jgi:hypothetical protein
MGEAVTHSHFPWVATEHSTYNALAPPTIAPSPFTPLSRPRIPARPAVGVSFRRPQTRHINNFSAPASKAFSSPRHSPNAPRHLCSCINSSKIYFSQLYSTPSPPNQITPLSTCSATSSSPSLLLRWLSPPLLSSVSKQQAEGHCCILRRTI